VSAIIVGILALQGDFAKHQEMVKSLGFAVQYVRTPQELAKCDCLIIPGGESTAIYRRLSFIELIDPLVQFAAQKPVFGTCAGVILMSNHIQAESFVNPLKLIDVTIERNAFGRQSDSFQTEVTVSLPGSKKPLPIPAYFIRAPRIKEWGEKVQILAEFEGEPILVQQGRLLGATFHPELTSDGAIHRYFISLCMDKN